MERELRDTKQWMFWKRKRYIVALLAFWGFCNVYILRVNLSVAVVAMNSPYNVTLDNGTVVEKQDFDWDSKAQGIILSSFFYGYICTNLLGGWLGARVGGSRLLGLGIGVTALFTTLTPPIANTNVYLLLVVRVIEGLFEGVTFPCVHAVFAQWAPPQELSIMVAVVFSGIPIGTVVGLQISGLIGSTLGWPAIFYITGAIGLVWCAVWFTVAKDRPDDDPHISSEELKYIKDSIGNNDIKANKIKHPWCKILTSVPFWATVTASFCGIWTHYTLLTQLPMFLKDTFDFQLAKAGFLSSLPYIVMGVVMQFGGGLSDYLRSTKTLTTGQVRKLFVSGPLLCQAVSLYFAAQLQTPLGVILCLIINVGMEGLAIPSFCVNHLDIAPRHASVMYGISNTIATVPGIVSPLITGFIVTDKSAEQWRIVFYISSCICIVGALVFGIFSSGEKQPWAMEEDQNVSENGKRDVQVYCNNGVSDGPV